MQGIRFRNFLRIFILMNLHLFLRKEKKRIGIIGKQKLLIMAHFLLNPIRFQVIRILRHIPEFFLLKSIKNCIFLHRCMIQK